MEFYIYLFNNFKKILLLTCNIIYAIIFCSKISYFRENTDAGEKTLSDGECFFEAQICYLFEGFAGDIDCISCAASDFLYDRNVAGYTFYYWCCHDFLFCAALYRRHCYFAFLAYECVVDCRLHKRERNSTVFKIVFADAGLLRGSIGHCQFAERRSCKVVYRSNCCYCGGFGGL